MVDSIRVEIRGLKELQRKATQVITDIHGEPIVNAIRDSTLLVLRGAKKNAPVDTGRLRASLTPEVRSVGADVIGIVGTNVVYAPYMELGTRPHWPPPGALAVWARRHHMSEFAVRLSISIKGTKPRWFLKSAYEDNLDRIKSILDRAMKKIIDKR